MTLLASWIGIDTHGPTSAYIVSESRFVWDSSRHFDYGKKVFASKSYPEIFGYAGDVLFPSIVLSQILEMIDSGLIFDKNMSCDQKNKIVYEKLCYSFSKYPDVCGNNPIQIIHLSRDTCFKGYPSFHHYLMTWSRTSGGKHIEYPIPEKSVLVHVLGSGSNEFNKNYYDRYQHSKNRFTSRNVFHCFIDTLKNITDEHCGGAPQLVGIYRKPCTFGCEYGIIYNRRRYFLGMEIPKDAFFAKVEWRNGFFELCDGEKRKKFDSAAKQNDPLRR